MSRRTIVSIFVVVGALVTAAALNAHCGKCPGDAAVAKAVCAADANQVKVACGCAWCTAAKADANGVLAQMKHCPMATKMNMPMCKVVRGKMAMDAQLLPTDPAALLAIAEQLELNEQQTAKLNSILENARKETQAVLTEEQMTKVKALGEASVTGKQMYGKMMGWGKMTAGCKTESESCETKEKPCKKTCPLAATAEESAETK